MDTPMDTTNAKAGCQETPVAPTLKKRRHRHLTVEQSCEKRPCV